MTDVRPLRIHDLPFVYRLAGQGINLDAQISLTVGSDSLRHALLTSSSRMQAYVLRSSGGGAVGQLHFLQNTQHARLAYLAPTLQAGASEALWLDLLEGLTVMAGERGVVSIIAEIDERAAEFDILRQAGFAIYARQSLWRRQSSPHVKSGHSLRLARMDESQAILNLYGTLAPGLIKQIEPPPTSADNCYILQGKRGILGMVAIYHGSHGTLIEPYLAHDADIGPREFLNSVLAMLNANKHPVYCRLRDYMGCVGDTLADVGFEQLTTQVVMFRHTAVRTSHRTYKLIEKVEGGVPQPTAIVENEEDSLPSAALLSENKNIG